VNLKENTIPNLRNSIIEQVLDYLEYSDFCTEDFDIKFPDSGNVLAEIVFKSMPQYSFILDETLSGGSMATMLLISGQSNGKMVIRTIEEPGEYKNTETQIHDAIDSAIQRISSWVINVRDDIINSRAVVRATIDDLTDDFQKRMDESIDEPESYFDEDEKDELTKKLDELQARVSEIESKLDITPEETAKIQKVIDKSKSNLKVYPKGVWYKTTGTKIIKVMTGILKTSEGRKFIADMTKKLLSTL